jgi:ADP-ribose pyrophosphatase YjhB (NUDIX family)
MAYDPEKAYFYVEHPTEGWRVYLRACCFLHEKPEEGRCVDMSRFLVVKRAGAPENGKSWEPPKGQMEGKDAMRHPRTPVIRLLEENVKREVAEESRVQRLEGLEHTGLVFQGRESNYPPNWYFQYHIFHAIVKPKEWLAAAEELAWYREHPKAFARLRRDHREKDALTWFSPSDTKLMGKWSPKLVAMYLSRYSA